MKLIFHFEVTFLSKKPHTSLFLVVLILLVFSNVLFVDKSFFATLRFPVELHEVTRVVPNATTSAYTTKRHLITSLSTNGYHTARTTELLQVLEKNLNLPYLHKVHLLGEGVQDALEHLANHTNLELVPFKTQPTYQDLFLYASNNVPEGHLAIIANGDIYFDKSLDCLKAAKGPSTRMISQSRRPSPLCRSKGDHKGIKDLCLHYIGSHDTFIFQVPLNATTSMLSRLNFTQNVGHGAENRVLWEFQKASSSYHYRVYNPCKLIRALHLHCSGERHYKHKGKQVSQAKYNNGIRKHGWVKPWKYKEELTCPFYL